MSISQAFAFNVARVAKDKAQLVELMNQLDAEKRSIRSYMRQYSNLPVGEGGLAGSERFKKLRTLKDRLAHLIDEREYVRQTLGALKSNQKALNKTASGRRIDFAQAFMAAAERTLSEEQFTAIEAQAAHLLMQEHVSNNKRLAEKHPQPWNTQEHPKR